MITTSQTQWIAGLSSADPSDSYTLMHESGALVAHIQRQGRGWQTFWYDGTPAGYFDSLGDAMDFLESPAPECAAPDCDSLPGIGLLHCYDCLCEDDPTTLTFDKDWI